MIKVGNSMLETVSISALNTNTSIKTVYISPLGMRKCPLCGRETLSNYVLPVILSNKQGVKLTGRVCHKCDAFFSVNRNLFLQLEAIRINKETYKLDRSFDVPYPSRAVSPIPASAFLQITVCAPERITTFSIVSRKEDENLFLDRIHYSSALALEFLTTILLGKSVIEIKKTKYVIQTIRRTNYYHSSIRFLSPSQYVRITTKKNGGYYSIDPDIVQMDGLVFCAATQRLEILPISFNMKSGDYTVDRYILHKFIKRTGFPMIIPVNDSDDNRYNKYGYYDLNEESILHALGYNVGRSDNLSTEERQMILSGVVESGLLEVYNIVNHLRFLIKLNEQKYSMEEACYKWEMDKEFISKYKRNHKQFVFVNAVKSIKTMNSSTILDYIFPIR